MATSNTPAPATPVSAPSNMQQMGAATSVIPPQAWFYIIGVPLFVGGVYFILVKPLMTKLGGLTQADKLADKQNDKMKRQPFWTPAYYKSYGGNSLQTWEAASFATRIYDCMHAWDSWSTPFGWGTDEACVAGVFNLLGSKGNISMVSEQYALLYNKDLYNDMESEMDATEMLQITQKISQYAS